MKNIQTTPPEILEYLEKMRTIQKSLLDFLDNGFDIEENYQVLIELIEKSKIQENKYSLKSFLYLILNISKNHYHTLNFYSKIEKILIFIKSDIKEKFSDLELFNLFKNHKRLILFLSNEKIVDKETFFKQFGTIPNQRYDQFFYPQYFFNEIQPFISKDIQESIKPSENVENFDELRRIGENHRYICQLIQNDSIDEFISFTKKKNFSFSSKINPSIFETNYLLLKNEPTLIEYAAFYGAIKIFKFLQIKGIALTSSIWIYAIHSSNCLQLIHILEDNNIGPNDQTYIECLKESIKSYNNDIVHYFFDMYVKEKITDLKDLSVYGMQAHNYDYFITNPNESIINYLDSLCKYDHYELVELLFTKYKIKANFCCNSIQLLTAAALKNNEDIIDFLMKQPKVKISSGVFKNCQRLTQITIPSTITHIGPLAFYECISLKSIIIPLSVTKIDNGAFQRCKSLQKVEILGPIISLDYKTFSDCFSLTYIQIPSSVLTIGKECFQNCYSLKNIKLPNGLKEICDQAFQNCDSLVKIHMPSSVTKIGSYVFDECCSLANIFLSSSINQIKSHSFYNCEKLVQIILPPTLSFIEENAFNICSSLTIIEIPNSVKRIQKKAFKDCKNLKFAFLPNKLNKIEELTFMGCSSLLRIEIPETVVEIESQSFANCSSLEQVLFEAPSLLTAIGDYAFEGCSNLIQIQIPEKVNYIGFDVFLNCSSLKEITISSKLNPEFLHNLSQSVKLVTV